MRMESSCPELSAAQGYSRIATEDDRAGITSMVNRAFAYDNPYLLQDRADRGEIQNMMERGCFLLLEEAGKIVSLVYVEIRAGARGYLGLLVVEPTRHRSGLGRQMLCAGENYCRQHGCRIIEVAVIDRRPDLLARYRKFGFRVTGVIPGDRPDLVEGGYSLIHIEKDLANPDGAPLFEAGA